MSSSESESEADGNSTDSSDEETNPLLLEPVISTLLKYLPLSDLIRARAVCSIWKRLATPVLENLSDKLTIEFAFHDPAENDASILSYLDMLKGSNLIFPSFRLGSGINLKSVESRALLETFPETTTKLALVYNETSTNLTRGMFRELLLEKAPFLEELDLEMLPASLKSKRIFQNSDSVELELETISFNLLFQKAPYSAAFLEDIFKNAPHIKSLTITANFDDANAKAEELTILQTMAQHIGLERLTHLDLQLVDDNILLLLLQEDKFRLAPLQVFKAKSITISDSVILQAFLNMHQGTLEDLHLGLDSVRNSRIPLVFPIMQKLRKLRVVLYFCTIKFGILDYGLQFPKLEVLEYFAYDRETRRLDLAIFSSSSSACSSLKELELPMYLDKPAALKTIAAIFPNVLKLNIAAQKPEVMDELWECWPNLEKLAISIFWKPPPKSRKDKRMRTLDSVFTGFDEETCMVLKRRLLNGEHVDFNGTELERKEWSIARLTNLKYLIIHGAVNLSTWSSERMESKQLISYLTVMSAMSELKSLVCIIMEPKIFSVSRKHLLMLCSELELLEFEGTANFHAVKYNWLKKVKRLVPEYDWHTV